MSERIFALTGKFYNPPRELTDEEKNQFSSFLDTERNKNCAEQLKNMKGRDIMYAAMQFYSYLASRKALEFRRNKDIMDKTNIDGKTIFPDIKQFLINEMQKDIGAAIPSASYYDQSGDVSDSMASATADAPNDNVTQDGEALINTQISKVADQTLKQLVRLLNPWATRKRVYLCLDSKYATFSESNTKLTWSFTNTADQFGNSVNALGKVREITMMRIYSAVITQFPTNQFNRGTICVEEWRTQSFKMPGGRCFHFVGLLNNLNAQVPLTSRSVLTAFTVPDPITWNKYELLSGYRYNEGKYYFNKPITTIDTITLTFGSPITLLNIQKYININCTITNLAAGVDYAALTDLNILFPEPHYYNVSGVLRPSIFSVYIQDFTTDQPIADKAVIDDINSTEFTLGFVDTTTTMIFRAFLVGLPGQNIFAWTPRTPPSPSILVGNPSKCTLLINGYRTIVNIELEVND